MSSRVPGGREERNAVAWLRGEQRPPRFQRRQSVRGVHPLRHDAAHVDAPRVPAADQRPRRRLPQGAGAAASERRLRGGWRRAALG